MPANDPDREFEEPANPYAPPEVDLDADWSEARRPKGGDLAYEPFSASLVIGRTWEIFKAEFGLVLGAVLGALGLNMFYNMIGGAMQETVDLESTMGQLGQVAFTAAGLVLQIWLTCGQTLLLLKVARNEPAQFSDLFQGGPYFLRYLGATLLYSLIYVLVMALCVAPAALVYAALGPGGLPLGLALGFGFVTGVVLLVGISVRLYHYPYVIVDREAGAVESLRTSFELTRGHAFELTGLLFIGGVIAISGVLLFLVGIFVTVPLSVFMFACTYVALANGFPRDFFLSAPGRPVERP